MAALTGLLYEVASVAYRVIVEGWSAAPDMGRFIGLGLAWAAASWLVALPATAFVGARLAESSRRALVAGYTVAAGASLTLFAVLVILVLNLPMPGPGAVAVTAVAAFGAAFVSAVLLTRPRGRGLSDSTHPGGKTDPAVPERTRAGADT